MLGLGLQITGRPEFRQNPTFPFLFYTNISSGGAKYYLDKLRKTFEKYKKSLFYNKNAKQKYYIVGHCKDYQAPNILKTIKNSTYLFFEVKRFFYEKASFDHYNTKQILVRLFLQQIKKKEIENIHSGKIKNIIAGSYFAKSELKKIHGSNSDVIYPGLKVVAPKQTKKVKLSNFYTLGTLNYLKGHDIAIRSIPDDAKLTILGSVSKRDTEVIIKMASKKKNIKVILNPSDRLVKKYQNNPKLVFLACNRNEPFGLATLEASLKQAVIGINEGGTSEIIQHGINGYLLPNEANLKKFLAETREITFSLINEVNWVDNAEKIIKITDTY